MILFKDRVAADFLVRSMESHNIGLEWSWDILVGTVWFHQFLCLHEYILTGKYTLAFELFSVLCLIRKLFI